MTTGGPKRGRSARTRVSAPVTGPSLAHLVAQIGTALPHRDEQLLSLGEVRDDVGRRPYGADEPCGLADPHRGLVASNAAGLELGLATVPGVGEGVADGAPAVL